ncbi:MAG TPA: hypothetical protein VN857_08880 [Chthoniobacterales bacterium]|nr:hypothetical protein [Chthoniobacterales bacterium]
MNRSQQTGTLDETWGDNLGAELWFAKTPADREINNIKLPIPEFIGGETLIA